MYLNDIMENLRDVELGERPAMSRELAREAREALMMLAERPLGAAGMERRTGDADSNVASLLGMTEGVEVGEPGAFRYDPNAYAGALLALGELQKAAERPEEKAAVSLLFEAVAEKAEREYPGRFRRAD